TIHLFGGASGGIATKFKKGYIEKSVSILLDDSLCSTDGGTKISALPVPYLHPDESCFPLYKRNLKTGKFEPNDRDPLDIRSLAFIDPYPEFQLHRTVHGPVKVDEAVEKFVIRRPHMCPPIVERRLRESGIPYISDFRGS